MLLLKKAKLKVPLSSGSESNLLFAIASAESDLRICMILNQALSINLSLAENLQIIRKQQTISFRRYSFEGAEGIEKYSLFINRSGPDYLLPEIKKIDFILHIQSEGPLTPLENLSQQLKAIPEITAIYKLDQKVSKSFERLLN